MSAQVSGADISKPIKQHIKPTCMALEQEKKYVLCFFFNLDELTL